MPNFPSIYLELQEIRKKIIYLNNQILTLQDKTKCFSKNENSISFDCDTYLSGNNTYFNGLNNNISNNVLVFNQTLKKVYVKYGFDYKGDTGEQGPQGIDGPQGPQGEKGLTGPVGIQGIKGDTGPKGWEGLPGEIGDRGIIGDKGPQGDQGPDGTDYYILNSNNLTDINISPVEGTGYLNITNFTPLTRIIRIGDLVQIYVELNEADGGININDSAWIALSIGDVNNMPDEQMSMYNGFGTNSLVGGYHAYCYVKMNGGGEAEQTFKSVKQMPTSIEVASSNRIKIKILEDTLYNTGLTFNKVVFYITYLASGS